MDIYRDIDDKCPGCFVEFHGPRWKVEGATVYHKGRCALYKAWVVIETAAV